MNSAGPSATRRMSFHRVVTLCLKELRESLRDRRTLVTLIVMPLIVYPLLSIIFQRFLLNTAADYPTDILIGVPDEQTEQLLGKLAEADDRLLAFRSANEYEQRLLRGARLLIMQVDDLSRAVLTREIDLGVQLIAESGSAYDGPTHAQFVLNPQNVRGRITADCIEAELLEIQRKQWSEVQQQFGSALRVPLQINRQRIYPPSDVSQSLATLIPLVLVLMTVTGAVYPAIDLTAGERERGTLEALIAAPVPRWELLAAKYVAVMTVAVLTAGANLMAMTLTLWTSGLSQTLFGTDGLGVLGLSITFSLMILFATFFSAVLLSVTSFARTFKEAQAYIIPLILLSLAPSLLCLAPGVKLTHWLAVAPLANIVLLARDVFAHEITWSVVPLVVTSTMIYALAGISVAARVFGSDAILESSHTSLRELFAGRTTTGQVPSLAGAALYLAILFPLYVWSAHGISLAQDMSLIVRLAASSAVALVLFALIPLGLVRAFALSGRLTFWGNMPKAVSVLGAIILGCSMWPLLHELFVWSQGGGMQVPPGTLDTLETFVAQLRAMPLAIVLLAMAVLPALCEELFFRGFLMSALATRTTAVRSIFYSAVLFGLFHVIAQSSLAYERMLPSTCIGLVLGWLRWRTSSVLPGIIVHAFHNGLLTLLILYQPELKSWGWATQAGTHVPLTWIGLAAFGSCVGLLLIQIGITRPSRTNVQGPDATWKLQ